MWASLSYPRKKIGAGIYVGVKRKSATESRRREVRR
jgi:hypothetical protein